MYRHETRTLLALICPDARLEDNANEWEKKACELLNAWIANNRAKKESKVFSERSEWVVVNNFAALLKPFGMPNGSSTKDLQKNAKLTLRKDKSGLTLSLIFSHENLQRGKGDMPKGWAWRELVFDGYKIEVFGVIVTKVKSGNALSTAKKQLNLLARFLDVVASCVESAKFGHVVLVAAILKSGVDQVGGEEQLDSTTYDKIQQLTLKTEYFRL